METNVYEIYYKTGSKVHQLGKRFEIVESDVIKKAYVFYSEAGGIVGHHDCENVNGVSFIRTYDPEKVDKPATVRRKPRITDRF